MNPTQKSHSYLYAYILVPFLLLGTGGTGCAEKPQPIKAPSIVLQDLQGKPLSLEQFKGKVIFLEFWATWCPPCVVSLPHIEKLNEESKGKPVQIISLSLDQDASTVKEFVSRHQMTSRIGLVADSGVDVKYGVQGIPAFFVVDQNGYATAAWQGFSPLMPRQWRNEINRLLSQ